MPRITLCIPHWQVRGLATLCLRSIRKHSQNYDLEILVVDNGSRDDSLSYLRSLPGIRLIERPHEGPHNWPRNVFTAFNLGLAHATGDYFVTLHSDVVVRSDNWLDPLLMELENRCEYAAAGSWKLNGDSAWYEWQKLVIGGAWARIKSWFRGRPSRAVWKGGCFPRDYCAMYRTAVLRHHGLSFVPMPGEITGGYAMARQLWELGFRSSLVSKHEMRRNMVHVAHGTAAIVAEAMLNNRLSQRKVESRIIQLFTEPWIRDLFERQDLDGPPQHEISVSLESRRVILPIQRAA